MSAKNETKHPKANTGAAYSGFFTYPKLYHLLKPNTGAGFGLFGMVFPSVCMAENWPETVPALPSGLGFGVLLVASLLVASLWENPRDGRSPRQRRAGIFHRLRAMLPRFAWLERAAAWWILRVVNPPADASFDLAWWVGQRLWPRHVQEVADFVQVWLVPSLLLDFLAWPFAYEYLRAKAKQENEGRSS